MVELRVRVLGGLAVEGLEATALGSRKQRRLLARLVVARGAAVSTDELADDLWGDVQPAQPRDQVSVLVSRLRSALGDAVVRHDAGYALTVDWSDLAALTERQQEALRRAAGEHWASAAAAARAALALLRGGVLPEFDDASWVEAEQVAVDSTAQQMRLVLARAELAVGDPRLAADVAREALLASPYDEVALRLHLDACLAARTPALGLATFAAARTRLADELGVDPSAETIAAYERLLHATGTDAPVLPISDGAPAGRGGEIGRALHAIDEAGQGRPSLTAFVGEPGIGKTSVLQAIAAMTSHPVLSAHCDELGRVLPLQPVLTALGKVLRLPPTDDVHALLGDDAPVVAPLIGLEASSQPIGEPDAGTGQLLVQAAILRVLDRLAGTGAVVLLVDDAHHADPATAALLAGVPRGASRVAVFVAARAGEGPEWPEGSVVELGPLDVDAVAQVVGAERATSLHARSGGHPLLLTELAASEDDDAVPDGLRAAFAAAADSAGRTGGTLRAASVLGPDLDLDVLADVLRRPAVELLDDLEAGVRRRLLVEDPSGFRFRHALVREALAADVGPTRRALLHRETARSLQARGGGDPLILATHARAGGATDIAADAFAQAAQIAAGRQAHEDALRLADESLRSDPSHAQAWLLRARALLVLGRYDAAAAAATTAVDNGAGAAARQVAGLAAYYRRDWQLAMELVDRAAEEAADPDLRATSLAASAHVRHAVGDLPGADARFAAAEDAAGERSRVPRGWVALLRHHQGRSEETLALTDAGSESTLLEQFTLPMVQMSRGLAFAAVGRSADALVCFDRMVETVDRFGVVRYAGRVDNCRGYVLRNLGLHGLADDHNTAGRESAAHGGTGEAVAHAVLDLAEGRLRAGDLEAVARLLDDADVLGEADQRHAFQWRHRARAAWLRGRLHLALGEVDDAGACAAAVIDEATRSDVARYRALGELLAVQVRITDGHQPEPAQVLAAVDRLTCLAGMEQLWLIHELAAASPGPLQAPLDHRAVAAADVLVGHSPPELTEQVRRHVATLLA